ncbi:hypothetical protein [Herbaspirillum robiniae]|uniref:hypothetical protein n=1 Tax=Herbaspirillum robiniae TaxID=2014887 RepID=UPI0011E4D3F0|nr:hypothetical protein [Herbaspirillum robiniae]
MSRANTGGGGNDLMLVAVLVVGAMMYTRMRGATAGTPVRTVYAPASAPASNGSGVAQVATGIVGALGSWFSSGSNSLPDTYNGTSTTLNSFGLYGPIGGTAEDPWYG